MEKPEKIFAPAVNHSERENLVAAEALKLTRCGQMRKRAVELESVATG
jgi:hypothetical protein